MDKRALPRELADQSTWMEVEKIYATMRLTGGFMAKLELGQIVWYPQNRISHYYLVRRSDGSFDMIDTTAPLERFRIEYRCRTKNIQVHRLLLTHSHADHAGNADWLRQKHDCGVFAHQLELPFLMGEARMKNRDYTGINLFGRVVQLGDFLFDQPICREARPFHDSHELLQDYEFVPLHGHTKGSTGIIHKPTRSIFLGDALLNNSAIEMFPQTGLRLPYHFFSDDHDQALRSLHNLREVDFDNAFFGHGDPIIGDAKKKIVELLNSLEEDPA
jgi:glyoxylase-like metal-dependent hydrolase (beta-lactamase superfamily II)